jgi:FMN reductase
MTQPLILGLGGTLRPGSSTERALAASLKAAEATGARTLLLGGPFLARLPIFDPRTETPDAAQAELVAAVRGATGVIVATPGYHGSLSGLVKNALDTLELTRGDAAPYLTGRAVGTIVVTEGDQAAGSTLMTLRSIIHALRGWPTPFGAALNATGGLFDDNGGLVDTRDEQRLAIVAGQVCDFARMWKA